MFKKKCACHGAVIELLEYGDQQENQHKNTCQFLLETGLAQDDQLNGVSWALSAFGFTEA